MEVDVCKMVDHKNGALSHVLLKKQPRNSLSNKLERARATTQPQTS